MGRDASAAFQGAMLSVLNVGASARRQRIAHRLSPNGESINALC
jgi:hypothetical protein